ncbi:MAG: diphthine--ammonia ligase [Candidatus Woesearchaeota archaeon]|nr:diphthine--ammonia ligase [Candidatus Woesearchaeota archaeon]
MCGILALFGTWKTNDIITAFEKIEHRGQDSYGFVDDEEEFHAKKKEGFFSQLRKKPTHKNIVLHNLHAIVGHCPQPIKEGTAVLAFNGEIYNWRMLNEMYHCNAANDTEALSNLLQHQGEENTIECLNELDGVFAFIFKNNNKIILARDIIGEKPLFYWQGAQGLVAASEKKCIRALGKEPVEVNPRKVITYDIESQKIETQRRPFFEVTPEHKDAFETLKQKTQRFIEHAVEKRLPNKSQKMGILFSGGVDSTLLAWLCKKQGRDFVCYTAALEEPGMQPAPDFVSAKKTAHQLDFELKSITIPVGKVPDYLKKIVPLIEDANVVKVGVAIPFFLAAEQAKKDGVRILFSGIGSEELFGGYERHEKAHNINKECVSGLLKMHERDLYRDDVVMMAHTIELRAPFLDKELVEYALKIPALYKIRDGIKKYILRCIAEQEGMPREFAFRKKEAAQYGSRFDRALEKLARREKKTKSQYLAQFLPHANKKVGVLFSGGKDSTYAAWLMKQQNYEISCLITLKSKNPDSYMFHTPNIHLVDTQAEALGIPLLVQETEGEKEHELADLKKAIVQAQKKYGIEGVVTGALASSYQRDRIEKVCDELGLTVFSPLWHKDQEQELHEILDAGFSFIIVKVASEGLDKTWLGRVITEKDINRLVELNKKTGLNIAFEGGEAETLMIDGPLFKKRIEIEESEIVEESTNCAQMVIKKTTLVSKAT